MTKLQNLRRLGYYRVRLCRLPSAEEGDQWIVQFWPQQTVRPPKWLVRLPRTTAGWAHMVADPRTVFEDVYAVVSWSPDASVVTSVTGLGRRLLLDQATIARTLQSPHEHLHITGTPDDPTAALTLTLVFDTGPAFQITYLWRARPSHQANPLRPSMYKAQDHVRFLCRRWRSAATRESTLRVGWPRAGIR